MTFYPVLFPKNSAFQTHNFGFGDGGRLEVYEFKVERKRNNLLAKLTRKKSKNNYTNVQQIHKDNTPDLA